ncbi:putative AIF-like mitochondrial oxidoreductase (Nfrl) [Aspergillus clavatus NRRL 1]|uniref:AIF-like mitochondrial oxidoreductase (Nfrl), putative n=1 Tax=Aspergillus clavatus (strain ATCC 1007 / CBS 513.65 / DSM 816 / NCTC 3887 / NRRL 1 / QM 1276 / 107) TaxID=344612 RepID=A1CG31_ASPCL|nr:AIF-like mitochondrial oxidoreductase (Nfrl), putative [Aspergillus clavatus NRRL 1]EAW10911.1 AIF-like mitochondrial oxidoreductase (Nfrl), putative [Aspergillus clavatus NRRL 1]
MHLPLPRRPRICCNPSQLQLHLQSSFSSLSSSGRSPLISSSPRRNTHCVCGCRNSAICSCSCCVHPSSPAPSARSHTSSSLSRSAIQISSRPFSSTAPHALARTPSTMAREYKLKDISSLADIKNMDKVESEVEGIEGGKVLVVRVGDQVHAMGSKCTHYGAPMKLGVVSPDGRITCAWHGACFNVGTGDVEDAPAPNALNKYEIVEKNGAVYIKGDEAAIKAGQKDAVFKCSVASPEKVVVVGGGSGTLGLIQALRELKYKGAITIISREPNLIIDRTKLSKALIPDPEKVQWRPKEWYEAASIDTVFDEVTSVDFSNKTVATKSGKSFPYTKLVLATGGVPRTLPLEGFKDLGNIFLLRFITDVQNILKAVGDKNKKIVVVGSSFIGMEVGNALSKENEVTIVGQEEAPMERIMGVEVGQIFQRNLEKAGVKFKMSAGVVKATPSDSDPSKVGAVHLKDGTVLPADLVILGVGVRPATDFLRDNPAVKLEKDGSIKTDDYFAVPGLNNDVFAIGDIATYPYHGPGTDLEKGTYTRIEHWNVAQNSGRGVARAIVHSLSTGSLQSLRPKAFIPIFWSALGAQLRYCGNTHNGWDGLVLKGEPMNAKFAAYYCKGDTVVAVATMGMDPIMSKCAELMRRGNMPGKKEIEEGVDVLEVEVPPQVKMSLR